MYHILWDLYMFEKLSLHFHNSNGCLRLFYCNFNIVKEKQNRLNLPHSFQKLERWSHLRNLIQEYQRQDSLDSPIQAYIMRYIHHNFKVLKGN